jgi:SAM-dependent methyltransferase
MEPARACGRCAAPCRWEGPVLNFLGEKAFQLPAANDISVAVWLVEDRSHLAAVIDGVKSPHGPAKEYPGEKLSANSSFSAADVAHMVASVPFLQIANDLQRILEGTPAPSETVDFMLSAAHIGPESRVLDVGCSCGRHLWELTPRSPRLLAGVDISLFSLAVGARVWEAQGILPRPRWCCASALQLPFKDESFTHVNSFVTLSVVPVRSALRELSRVLAPSGRITCTVEGTGFWQSNWDSAAALSLQRVHLLRWLVGNKLLQCGLDWQRYAFSRRLAGCTQFTPKTICRIVQKAGFVVEKWEVLRAYKTQPRLLGLVARKQPGERPFS